jgi:hypothetical protein
MGVIVMVPGNLFSGRRGRVAAAIATAMATVTAGLAVSAGPAAASLSGMYEQTAISADDSVRSKTVVATCPTGTVVGGGGIVSGGNGKVALEQVMPDISAGTLQVTAKETDNFTGNWTVEAVEMCAPAPAGLMRLSHHSVSNSDPKTMSTACPGTKTLLSVGWDIGNGDGEVFVNETVPFYSTGAAATSVEMSAYEDDAYPSDWTLTTHLLCADPISGQQVVSNYTVTDSNEPKGIDAACPATQNATGGSALAVSMNPATQSELIVNSAFTLSTYGGTLNVFQADGYEEDDIPDDWYLMAWALCV